MADFIIDDSTSNDVLFPSTNARGLIPRDYVADPEWLFSPPSEIKLIPSSEWDARIKEQEETQSSLEHLRMRAANGQQMATLDQNGQGYCWAYSVTRTVMYARAVANLPYVRLSAHGVACRVKNFRDEGGWCGLSAQFIRANGVPSVAAWPEKSMSRSADNETSRANAMLHKITEDWVDLTRPVHSQNLTFAMLATLLLTNTACAVDYNWWGHSVCAIRLVKVEAGSYGVKIDNSWTDGWGDRGMGVLRGGKEVPNGAVATRVTTPSSN